MKQAGMRMAALRRERGLTQGALAAVLHVSPQAVSKWENGHTMPEMSLLTALCQALGCTADAIIYERKAVRHGARFERLLLPAAPIAAFSGAKWPRSLSKAALMSSVKLFMGLEERRDAAGRQINDDAEYVLQAACTGIAFGYSWARQAGENEGWALYGLRCETHRREDCTDGEFVQLARENIDSGYPVIVQPRAYEDTLLAVGYADDGCVLKALAFLDGDDEKNSVMSFEGLKGYPDWAANEVDLLCLRPAERRTTVEEACHQALRDGYELLMNTVHHDELPLVGYGLVIYDNWIRLLEEESRAGLPGIACMYPHIFIHYEGKLRTKQFLEYCGHAIPDINQIALRRAIIKYEEIVHLCEQMIPHLVTEKPATIEAANAQRQQFIAMLQRTRELESEALAGWRFAI
ncbi:MAG: helix-turn-helix transcriptional regulator [Clostridia bacterium]|nr:helix-turn-helix transcriptional regulator [Clostridia bacterium]